MGTSGSEGRGEQTTARKRGTGGSPLTLHNATKRRDRDDVRTLDRTLSYSCRCLWIRTSGESDGGRSTATDREVLLSARCREGWWSSAMLMLEAEQGARDGHGLPARVDGALLDHACSSSGASSAS